MYVAVLGLHLCMKGEPIIIYYPNANFVVFQWYEKKPEKYQPIQLTDKIAEIHHIFKVKVFAIPCRCVIIGGTCSH